MPFSDLSRRAIPDGAVITDWQTPDGWSLRRFDWRVIEGVPRGSMLFQCGRGDFFEKYLELFAHWHSRGWNVSSFDWRGQGGSGRATDDPLCGDIADFAIYVVDLKAFWAEWRLEMPRPHIAIGHSMGGHLVLRALIERAIDPLGAVLIAPMLGLRGGPFGGGWAERAARLLGGVGNAARPAWRANAREGATEFRETLLTHDHDRYADELWWQHNSPALRLGPPSWRWVIEAFRSTRELRANPVLKALRTPVLMLIADSDGLIDPKASHAVAAKIRDARVVRFGEEAAHELLREADPVRNRAIGEIDLFLQSRARPA